MDRCEARGRLGAHSPHNTMESELRDATQTVDMRTLSAVTLDYLARVLAQQRGQDVRAIQVEMAERLRESQRQRKERPIVEVEPHDGTLTEEENETLNQAWGQSIETRALVQSLADVGIRYLAQHHGADHDQLRRDLMDRFAVLSDAYLSDEQPPGDHAE